MQTVVGQNTRACLTLPADHAGRGEKVTTAPARRCYSVFLQTCVPAEKLPKLPSPAAGDLVGIEISCRGKIHPITIALSTRTKLLRAGEARAVHGGNFLAGCGQRSAELLGSYLAAALVWARVSAWSRQ